MLKHYRMRGSAFGVLIALFLSACGGDGGGSSSATSSSALTGTAAVGAAISGTVYAIDVNGKISPAATTSATLSLIHI